MRDFRVATAVFHSPVGKTMENLERMEKMIKSAADKGASLICFPELSVTGYTTHDEIIHAAVSSPGIITERLKKVALRENIIVLAGIAETNHEGSAYASHLVLKPGKGIETYRKVHLAPPELKHFKPGNSIPVFNSSFARFGIQLCYDAHFPELSTRMALDGAEIIFIPHASPRGNSKEKFNSWMRHLTARAFDNSVFILACNQTGSNGLGLKFPGVALAISPSGEIINRKLLDRDNLLITDLKKEDLDRVRTHRMRYFLPNRRDDLYCSTHP